MIIDTGGHVPPAWQGVVPGFDQVRDGASDERRLRTDASVAQGDEAHGGCHGRRIGKLEVRFDAVPEAAVVVLECRKRVDHVVGRATSEVSAVQRRLEGTSALVQETAGPLEGLA